ncbi:D-arabinono-1,4-lactone oxidase [Rhodopirellula sp. JC639]|uniref:D-arabinono-1,4-lactone oxidase n=1 Tax=Stieleria mannarensis TaxID=2755585 RepID=UPI0025710123|nr:D-arabinono-1,4-lactone oxidase [Rhodopirellula sp. JC639]
MLLLAGDMARYREHTQEMLRRFEHPPNAYVAERTAKLSVLPTEPIGDKETVSRLAKFATENSEDSPWSMYFPMTEALVKYRYREPFENLAEILARSMGRLFRVRPHWGKLCPLPSDDLHALYPAMGRFREVCAESDPDGRFNNRWTESVIQHKDQFKYEKHKSSIA